MKTSIGLWIDHRKAVLVFVTGKKVGNKVIKSNVEKQLGRFEGIRSIASYESQLVPADDIQERKFAGHIGIYYDEVIACIRDAESVLIFGPGEAKRELMRHLKKNKICGYIESIETADKMTNPQIVAKVRQHFTRKRMALN